MNSKNEETRRLIIWLAALAIGAGLGFIHSTGLKDVVDFVATVFTRLFQLIAVPTIALAVITTLSSLGGRKESGKIFSRTLVYTLLTTFAATLLGLGLYLLIAPGNVPPEMIAASADKIPAEVEQTTYYEHIISAIPNNMVRPFLESNVLAVLLLAAAIGIALAKMPDSEPKRVVNNMFLGLQQILYMLIKGLIFILPVGIMAFAAQLTSEVSTGFVLGSIGKYVAVILSGNILQFILILPLFLIARGINPVKTFAAMSPAVLMALLTKSSAATLPVTIQSAEERLGADKKVARFVLPICTTINMNGCAAFVLVTSLFVMQNGGMQLTLPGMLLWVVLAVICAIGNAGVPMGCFFLTLSLVSGTGAPIGIMGVILPIYTILDMVETAENVWSDSCVCAMVNKDMTKDLLNLSDTEKIETQTNK